MAETMTLNDLTAAEKREATGLRRSVAGLARTLGIVRESVADLAPKVMKLFRAWEGKYEERLGGFVGFARLIDPSIPMQRDAKDGEPGYRDHKVYYALTYIRRTYQTANRARGQQGRRDPAGDQLARLLATILGAVSNPDPVWAGVAKEFRMGTRAIARLKTRVEAVEPLIKLPVRPVRVDEGAIMHMEPLQRPAAGAAAVDVEAAAERAMPRRGRAARGRERAAA